MTASERFLVTGALGCIGAWVIRQLVREGVDVVALDVGGSDHRLRQVLSASDLAGLERVECDITDLDALAAVVGSRAITRVIHLAALQVPFCRADPALGARVNVVGVVNVFEAVKTAGGIAGPVVYASSVAAYDATDIIGGAFEGVEPSGHASTHYGVYKLANEGTARVYWSDDLIPSIGLRPYVVYGVGRDQGMTASPTLAMLAAAAGRPYTISYSGRSHFQLAADVAASFIAAARSEFRGADVFNLGGAVVDMADVVAAIDVSCPAAAGLITIDGPALPFPAEVDHERFAREVAPEPSTPLLEGVRSTVALFADLCHSGDVNPDTMLGPMRESGR